MESDSRCCCPSINQNLLFVSSFFKCVHCKKWYSIKNVSMITEFCNLKIFNLFEQTCVSGRLEPEIKLLLLLLNTGSLTWWPDDCKHQNNLRLPDKRRKSNLLIFCQKNLTLSFYCLKIFCFWGIWKNLKGREIWCCIIQCMHDNSFIIIANDSLSTHAAPAHGVGLGLKSQNTQNEREMYHTTHEAAWWEKLYNMVHVDDIGHSALLSLFYTVDWNNNHLTHFLLQN